MVSDGMSPGVLTMAEAYSKLTRKCGTQWWSLLNWRAVLGQPSRPATAWPPRGRRCVELSVPNAQDAGGTADEAR